MIAFVGMVVAPNAAAIADVAPSLAAIGAMPRLPGGAVRIGALSAGTAITIGVALAIRRPEILAEAAAAAAADPSRGPRLTPRQFAALYGPSGQAVTAVSATLRSLGLTPGAPSSNGLVIPVRSTVGQVERAFHAQIDGVRLSSGSNGWAPESAPLLPSAVAPEVSAILGLANLTTPHDQLAARQVPAAKIAKTATARTSTGPAGAPQACAEARRDASSGGGWSDDQIAQAYGLDHLYAQGDLGAGQTVAIFELEPFAISDVATFDRCFFGRSHTSQVSVSTLDGFSLTGQGDGEAILDVEDVSALAPAAKINVYEAPNTSFGAIDEYNAIVSDDTANIISTSWGECESALDAGSPGSRTLENAIFEEAALQGQTVVAASGDDGSDDCANTPFGSSVAVQPYLSVDDPASQPYVLAVGGTSLDSIHPPLTARDETVWNDGSTDGAAGGGISITWPSPAWQAGSGVPGVGVSGNRQVPDVSAAADQSRGITVFSASAPASLVSSTDAPGSGIGWSTIGGTSSSAPIWAAILAEIAASGPIGTACASLPVTAGGPDLGFVPPDLYAVARVDFGGAYHDVSRGNNDAFGLGHGYPALPGFDTASGLGSPVVVGAKGTGGLASDLCSVAAGSMPQLPPRPVISALAPTAGSIDGGTVVTVTLASPVPAGVTATVQFGATTAPVVSISGTSITVTAPAAATTPGTAPFAGAGPIAVSVQYSGPLGVASSFPTTTDRYEYVATSGASVTPVVSGVGPSGGPTSGGGRITIYGSGFAVGTDTVTIGGVAAGGVMVVNNHEITATIPPKSATTMCATGTGFDAADDCQTDVVVTNSAGLSPTATVLPPLSGPVIFTPQGVVTSEPGTEIAPAATEYDYSPVPVITAVTPNPASSQGNLPVTITGSGFSLTNFEWVNFGPAANPDSQQLKIISITSHTVEIDPPAARSSDAAPLAGGVSVSTFAGVSNVLPFGYAGIPVVRSLSTHLGPAIGGTRITISGTDLAGVTSVNFVSALSVTRFGQSTTRVITPLSHGRIRVVSPAGLVGPVDVEPCTPSGCASANAQHDRFELFSIARPQVSSISPQSGPAGGGSLVTIRGNNLAGAVSVWFGGTSTSSFTNANGFAPGGPDAIAVFSAPGRAGTTVPVVVVTRTGKTVATQHLLYTYLPSGPSAPRRGSARNTPSGIAVVWKTPASNGGHPIIGYTVTATATGGTTVTRHVGPRVHQIVVSGVTPARSYNVVVRASNGTASLGLLDFVTVT